MTDIKEYKSTLTMPEKVELFNDLYGELAGYGTEGDTELAHVNTFEARLLKSIGGSGTINEITGLRQFGGGGGQPAPAPQQQGTPQDFWNNFGSAADRDPQTAWRYLNAAQQNPEVFRNKLLVME